MLKIWLIRHGMTEGNLHQRYIGTTDEPLCIQGKETLKMMVYPEPEALFVSPLLRCRETAEILFPDNEGEIIEELAECDFGEFENKNYKELSDNPHYQRWVDSNGTLPFPGGESKEQCRDRNLDGLEKIINICLKNKIQEAAAVVHGGTIMNIMEAYGEPKKSFYDWHAGNGQGYLVEVDTEAWKQGNKTLKVLKSTKK